jgi:hypothetical protein
MAFRVPAITQRAFGNPSAYTTGRVDIIVRTHMFFDRQAVKDALRYMNYHGLWRASVAVRRIAQKSIKQKGLAKPLPKIATLNQGVPLNTLINSPAISSRAKGALIKRIQEIQNPKGSPAGTPPFTHVPGGHMLGFRRNLYNAFDSNTQSAVIGPSKKGKQWSIPGLHEFGGVKRLRAWMYRSKWMKEPLVKWFPEEEAPESSLWVPMKKTRAMHYPKRPFMNPALKKAIQSGKVAAAFRNSFGPFRGRGGDYGGWQP